MWYSKCIVNQVVALRTLTGEDRLEQAFLLSEFVRELSVSNIKKKLGPKATNTAIALELRRRLQPNDRSTRHSD